MNLLTCDRSKPKLKATIHMDIGTLMYEIDDEKVDDALEHFDQAIELDGLNPEIFYARIQILTEESRYLEALEDAEEIQEGLNS